MLLFLIIYSLVTTLVIAGLIPILIIQKGKKQEPKPIYKQEQVLKKKGFQPSIIKHNSSFKKTYSITL